jgi:hypothetical protein
MGLFWNLIQHGQIRQTQDHASGLERRVEVLEEELRRTNDTLMSLLRILEERFGEDIDQDGRIG